MPLRVSYMRGVCSVQPLHVPFGLPVDRTTLPVEVAPLPWTVPVWSSPAYPRAVCLRHPVRPSDGV